MIVGGVHLATVAQCIRRVRGDRGEAPSGRGKELSAS
jgi:hypothetical protein